MNFRQNIKEKLKEGKTPQIDSQAKNEQNMLSGADITIYVSKLLRLNSDFFM